MKINGVKVSGPAEEVLVLPRPTAEDIVFRAKAVMEFSEFDNRCPFPKPQKKLVAGGWKESLDDPEYQRAVNEHGNLRFAWLILKSLEPSNIEWDTVNMGQPSTWGNWQKDLANAGLTVTEINRVVNCVCSANSLDEQKLEAARQLFLRGLAKASEEQSCQNSAPQNTQSGEPANG